jgi:hypothetical protein
MQLFAVVLVQCSTRFKGRYELPTTKEVNHKQRFIILTTPCQLADRMAGTKRCNPPNLFVS